MDAALHTLSTQVHELTLAVQLRQERKFNFCSLPLVVCMVW
jgi:hypothetical protein